MFFSCSYKEKHNGPIDAQCVALRQTGTVLSVSSDRTELAFSPNCALPCSQALTGPRRGPLRPPFFQHKPYWHSSVLSSTRDPALQKAFQQTQVQQTICVHRHKFADQNMTRVISDMLTSWFLIETKCRELCANWPQGKCKSLLCMYLDVLR